jgi:hypothetical protein
VSNLEGLGGSLNGAIEQLGKAQSSAGVTRDRGDEALRQLAQVSDGSDNALLSAALANVAGADDALQEVLGMYVAAVEQIEQYKQAKNIP